LSADVRIRLASAADAEQILKLQYLAYQTEATIYDCWQMPALSETLSDLLAAYSRSTILVAVLDAEVVGSVRGRIEAGTCHIGRLCVHPRLQAQGIGRKLMQEIERRSAQSAERFYLFTGWKSDRNLRLYEALGYERVPEEADEGRTQVHLEKPNRSGHFRRVDR
jgi:ribosomal protein S18 acetylase RimI-like enzyme